MPIYKLVETSNGIQIRGAAAQLWRERNHETIIAGPAETGKTFAALLKLNALLWKYAGAQGVIVRKTYNSAVGSVLQTYQRKIIGAAPIAIYGGNRPIWYDYPNGSRLWVGGMDNPGRVLSSERDFIYVNQAEELALNDWEYLVTRSTGRAGNAPYPLLFGDCNPGAPTHWIRLREQTGTLKLLHSRHEDNPCLYTPDGALTEQGERTLAILDALTGLRYKRLRLGLWVQAEGVIYETFDETAHVIPAFPIPAHWRRFRVIDFGYTNPFVCQWWAMDGDGRLYRYREIYQTKRTVRVHAEQIKRLSAGEHIEATICDHDAEDRATLEENGILTRQANKVVSVGIEKVQERLKFAGDGRPRLFFLRDALVEEDPELSETKKPLTTEQEFPGYVWSNTLRKEEPVKVDDHGMDATRYAVMYADTFTNPGRPQTTGVRMAIARPEPPGFQKAPILPGFGRRN